MDLDAWITKLAGLAGAAASLAFMKGTLTERVAMALGGAVVSLYATPWMTQVSGLPAGLCGFLLGLFGMAICAKVWELIAATPTAEVWRHAFDVIRKRLGG
ncbi:MAG: hypothetical protein ACK515_11940 [bacterium]|jgi:hypothetical protein